jgi:gluconokinase
MIMGVTGSGKTTVGEALARRLGWEFADADDFHSAANKRKIHDGVALTDADREPWLLALHGRVAEWAADGRDAVLACSALKDAYRRTIAVDGEPRVVYLRGTYEFIAARLAQRHGHFAGVSILKSQFEALEEPRDAAVTVELESPTTGARPVEEIVSEIMTRLRLA